MAIENLAILNGCIRDIKSVKKDGVITQIALGIEVLRRQNASVGNRAAPLQMDVVVVKVRKEEHLKYLLENRVFVGDMIEVAGLFCTINGVKKFLCPECKEYSRYSGSSSYVHPFFIELKEMPKHPKEFEDVTISIEERALNRDQIKDILRAKKKTPGDILSMEEVGRDSTHCKIRLMVRIPYTDSDVQNWLLWRAEISNRIFIMGNLCADPYISDDKNHCAYQLGINRKAYIPEDDPDIRADYPWVKSSKEQAQKDAEVLRMGSLIFVDGSVQARQGFTVEKECEHCGTKVQIRDRAMEIVPYAVEYLRNCIFEDEDDNNEFLYDDDFEEYEEYADDEEVYGDDGEYDDESIPDDEEEE